MHFASQLATAWGTATLLLSLGTVGASGYQAHVRLPASVSYKARNDCPELCSVSGPSPANWTVYRDLDQLSRCKETVFYHLSIHDAVDDRSTPHRIYACTSFGSTKKPGAELPQEKVAVQTIENANFTLGRWEESASRRGIDLRTLSKQMRRLLASGYTVAQDRALVLFAQTVTGTAGLYMGRDVNVAPTASSALVALENAIYSSKNSTSSVALQLCDDGHNADHVFGFIATSNRSFTPVQKALQSWSNATCLDFDMTEEITSPVSFSSPLLSSLNGSSALTNSSSTVRRQSIRGATLQRRGECTTVQVASGDSCSSLATKCGITGDELTEYNSASDFCSTLMPLQHVCCSDGDMPDFAPTQNSDGSCATYTIVADDTCPNIAAAYSITKDDIEDWNQNTWAWNGCDLLYIGNVICLSDGTPPMPASLANAECGPQVPGTEVPSTGTANISDLNPCPLNACCDVWGQCGTTSMFCTDTSTGAPGTAKNGTNGCISNCGTDIIQGTAPDTFISLAYYEGYSFGRDCLYQDARQIDTTKFTHLHFAFGVLSDAYEVSTGDDYSTYEFNAFRRLTSVQRVLSFGGWAFSTDTATYSIFREGVTSANRLTMATNIANFINDNDLDGVDIDWEYPGAPDIPGIPAGGDDDGANYLAFLVVLKNLLPGKTVSIAAPASYWYLKQFPIAEISKVVDYIVFMTYDLHGQWDAGNSYAQDGCSDGMCLRSHVNLTETKEALAMVTKAGVDSGKLVVGVSSYGRSFAMASAGCYTNDCKYTGTSSQSDATAGRCTGQGGYIGDAEIYEIVNGNSSSSKRSSRINQDYVDTDSHSRIIVYDDTQWVAFMDDDIRSARTTLYQGLSMGGTTNWASDLESFTDAPTTDGSWDTFKLSIKSGEDPYAEGQRNGNWTDITCDDQSVQDLKDLTPQERWDMMDAGDAWSDVIAVWRDYDKATGTHFTASVSNTIHGPELADCGTLLTTNNCEQTLQCDAFQGSGSGAAGYAIWNSMVIIHELYASYVDALYRAAAVSLDPALSDFMDQFAPIPPAPDTKWLDILLAATSLVGTVAVSGVFNTILKGLPYFKANSISYDNYKDTAKALVSFSTSLAGTLSGSGDNNGEWTVEKQDAFADYLGQVVSGWGNVTEMALAKLFSGSDDGIEMLTSLMGDGVFIAGSVDGGIGQPSVAEEGTTLAELEASLALAFFAFAIPTVWPLADYKAFVVDTGANCGAADGADLYIDDDTMSKTGACYDGKQYYLVYPSGTAQDCTSCEGCAVTCTDESFSMPPGLDTLDGTRFGGVTVSDLITGAVRTYIQNGNANGGAATDPTNSGSLDDLISQDITTPGFIRLPVCSADVAFTAWADTDIDTSVDNYPCYVKPSISDCGNSTFVDQTSDASPSVDDCMGIVNNIKGTQGEWEVENAIGSQHQIVQYGDCKFGVQGEGKNGNVDFNIGAQDIVDIITQAVDQFGGGIGKVGAKGEMSCSGTVKGQTVEWGLY